MSVKIEKVWLLIQWNDLRYTMESKSFENIRGVVGFSQSESCVDDSVARLAVG